MGMTQSVSVTGVAASVGLAPDTTNAADATGVYLKIGAGCTASVQVTPDDPSDAAATWFATGVTALTGATAGNVAALLGLPCRGIRLNQTAGAAASVLQITNTGRI